jgi:hypothetical protein
MQSSLEAHFYTRNFKRNKSGMSFERGSGRFPGRFDCGDIQAQTAWMKSQGFVDATVDPEDGA